MCNVKGQSARETSSHYWSLGRMQEDWHDMHASVWQMVVPPSSSTLMGQGIPSEAVLWMLNPPSDPLSRSHLWNVDPVSLVLVVRPMKMTHQGLLPWRAGISSGCGNGWLWRWQWDTGTTSYTPGLACGAPSTNDWWLFPHFALPSQTTDSGLPHWNDGVHMDGGYWSSLWPSGTLRGTLGERTLTPLAGFLRHSWHIPIHAFQSRYPGSHKSWSLIGLQIQSYSGRHPSDHRNSCC